MIERQLNHMVRLLGNQTEEERAANSDTSIHPQLVDLTDIVERAIEMSTLAFHARGHALTVSLPSEPSRLWCDPYRLIQVIVNLLNNAAKYTHAGERISLSVVDVGVGVTLRVKDDGIGLSAEMQERINDLLAQSDRLLDHSQCDMGIGLALSRNLVGLHGGTLHAVSEGPGKGTEFVVYLPRRSETIGHPQEPEESLARTNRV